MNKVQLLDLLPHRPPLLLLDELVHVDECSGSALIDVTPDSTFYVPGYGVPAWVGLEYMGQTAALIGGYQQRSTDLGEHTGFLLGSRKYSTTLSWFDVGTTLSIHCVQSALVGTTLANFTAEIHRQASADEPPIATAVLSVFREPRLSSTDSELTQ